MLVFDKSQGGKVSAIQDKIALAMQNFILPESHTLLPYKFLAAVYTSFPKPAHWH
jgi:hypothetical protein